MRLNFEGSLECGASCWLTTLPIAEYGFALPKGEFCNALCVRFGWQPVNLPQTCACGKIFSVDHVFTCPCGGFLSIRYNEIWDFTASLLSEVCCCDDSTLQPLNCEPLCMPLPTGKMVLVLMLLLGIWGEGISNVRSLTLVCFILLHACTYSHFPLSSSRSYKIPEQEKRQAYDERIREVERACFSPLIFAATGGMRPYFFLLRSVVMCLSIQILS